MGAERFTVTERWPGILQELLGSDYEIIEEGLGARTTMFDDPRPDFPERNGLKTLPIILETHLPLDLVIIMLGTTDTKEMIGVSSEEIVEGMRRLVGVVKGYRALKDSTVPQILIVVPPIVKEDAEFASKLFRGGSAKGNDLIDGYRTLAESEKILYLDPTGVVKVDPKEGVHMDAKNHRRLAELIHKKVLGLYS